MLTFWIESFTLVASISRFPYLGNIRSLGFFLESSPMCAEGVCYFKADPLASCMF